MEIVKIKFVDMTFNSEVWARKDISSFDLIEIEIVGWLAEDRKDCIVVAKEYYPENDQFRHLSAIPKVCVREIRKFRIRKR